MAKRIDQMAGLFQALGDPTRLRILGLLLTGEVCVCDIHESLAIAQPKASRHLAYLRKAGLVDTRREGLWVHYRLAAPTDPVMVAVTDAVRHALTHLGEVNSDARRLQARTDCCLPTPTDVPSAHAACCEPAAVPVTVMRRKR